MQTRSMKNKNTRKFAIGLSIMFLGLIAIGKLISGIQLPVVNDGLSLPTVSIFTAIIIYAAVNVVLLGLISFNKIKENLFPVLLITFLGLIVGIGVISNLFVPN